MIDTITVGGRNFGVSVDPGTESVYVAGADGDVVVIDTKTRQVLGTVTIPVEVHLRGTGCCAPWDIAVDAAAGEVYVSYPGAGTVAVVDTATRTVVGVVAVGRGPLPVAVDPVARVLYVGNREDGTVSVIDTRTREVVDTIPVLDATTENKPGDIAVDPVGGAVYVTNPSEGTVSVIDTSTREVVGTLKGFTNPTGVTVDPVGAAVYVTDSGAGTMTILDTTTRQIEATIDVASQDWPGGVAVDPVADAVYVNTGDSVWVIDTFTRKAVDIIRGGGGMVLAVDPSTGVVYEPNGDWGSVSVFGAP